MAPIAPAFPLCEESGTVSMSKKIPIRWYLFSHYILFCVVLLSVLFVVQIAFTDDFYRLHTRRQLISQSDLLTENIDNPELDILMTSLSREHSLSIYLINEEYQIESRAEYSRPTSLVQSRSWFRDIWHLSDKGTFYLSVVESFQSYLNTYSRYEANHFSGDVPQESLPENMICARVVPLKSGEQVLLILVSCVKPSTATRELIQNISLVLLLFMLAFSFLFAWFSSLGFARPIRNFSESVHRVSEGDYTVHFHSDSNREFSQLGKALNHMVDQFSKTEDLRRELIATASHDLRTPLTMLRGYAEMMRDIPGENTPENAQIVIDEANRLSTFVNNILDLSRLRSGTQEMHPVVFCLTDRVRDLVNTFQKLSGGQNDVRFSPKTSVFVHADEIYISRAINNLIHNAVVHGNADTTVTVLQTVKNGRVTITVQDNGPGIPDDQLKEIWERYQKGSPSGTGLGLPIVKAAVEQNNGTCGVESVFGEGSSFWIELPVADEPKEKSDAD